MSGLEQYSKHSSQSSAALKWQDFICLIMQLGLEEPALHPEGLVYIRACHVVKPEGLSGFSTQVQLGSNDFESVEGNHVDKAIS